MIECKFWIDNESRWGEGVFIDVYQIPLTVKERHDEQLATASFMSWENKFPYKLPLKPYTKCRLTTETDTFDYVVYSCDTTIVKMGAKLRRVDVSLIEQLAITQEIYPDTLMFSHEKLTIFEPNPRKIGEVLQRVRSQLWTVPVEDKTDPKYFPFDFYWNEFADWTNKTAPELVFADKSLFEILLQIGAIIGGFPKIRWDENERKYELTWRMWDAYVKNHVDQNVVSISSHSTIEGHSNILVGNLENLQNMSLDGENTVVEPCEGGFMPVSVENYEVNITDEAAGFEVSKDIARILSITFYHRYIGKSKTKTYTDADTDRIFMEYDEWLTLPTYQWGIIGSRWSREGVLWYKRGERRIHNLAANGVGELSPSPIARIVKEIGIWGHAGTEIDLEPKSLCARITYIPYQTAKYKAYKPNADKPLTAVYNQAEKTISPGAIGSNMQGAADRAEGVYGKTQKRFNRGDELYKIGEKLNGEIIVAADYEYGVNKINAIYETAPFNRRSQYVGIDNKIRTWNIPNDNIQDRILHYAETMEVEINAQEPVPNNGSLTEVGHSLALYYNDATYKRPDLAYIAWKPKAEMLSDGDDISTNYAVVTLTSIPIGKSICMQWEAADNASMGNRSYNTTLPDTDANVQNYIPYNERARWLNMVFANALPDYYNFRNDLLPKGGEEGNNRDFEFSRPALTAKSFRVKYNLERYSETIVKFKEFEILKDIRERIKFVYQLDFVGKNDTIVYERAITYNRLVNRYTTRLKVWINSAKPYNPYDYKVHYDAILLLTGVTIGNYSNLAVTDYEGRLLFATNKRGNIPNLTENIMNAIQFSNRKKEWVRL